MAPVPLVPLVLLVPWSLPARWTGLDLARDWESQGNTNHQKMMLTRKHHGLSIKNSGLSIKHDGLSIKNYGLSIEHDGLSIENSSLSIKNDGCIRF